MAYEKTLVLIKPGVLKRKIIGEIITRFEKKDLTIAALKLFSPSKPVITKLYIEHKKQPFFESLVTYMVSGPIIAMVIGGLEAVKLCRGLIGATNPQNALPGSIRGDYGIDVPENIVHASDSLSSAKKEIALFFTATEILKR